MRTRTGAARDRRPSGSGRPAVIGPFRDASRHPAVGRPTGGQHWVASSGETSTVLSHLDPTTGRYSHAPGEAAAVPHLARRSLARGHLGHRTAVRRRTNPQTIDFPRPTWCRRRHSTRAANHPFRAPPGAPPTRHCTLRPILPEAPPRPRARPHRCSQSSTSSRLAGVYVSTTSTLRTAPRRASR